MPSPGRITVTVEFPFTCTATITGPITATIPATITTTINQVRPVPIGNCGSHV